MSSRDDEKLKQFYDDVRRERRESQHSYRERALAILPHVCALCGREFDGKRLRELTVHHKDHNHDNNPPDGSNWELLCIYCHDEMHARADHARWVAEADTAEPQPAQPATAAAGYKPFAGLDALLARKKKTTGKQ